MEQRLMMKRQRFLPGNCTRSHLSSGAEKHRQDQGTSCLHFDSTDHDFALISIQLIRDRSGNIAGLRFYEPGYTHRMTKISI